MGESALFVGPVHVFSAVADAGADSGRGRSAGGPFLDAKYGAYRSWEQDKALPDDDQWSARFDELARDRFLLGDPARVREEMARYREQLGITTLIVRVQWPGMAQEAVLRSIRLLGEQVLPTLPR